MKRPGLFVLVAVGVLALLFWRATGVAAPAVEIPDPRTPEMPAPVRRLLTATREAVEADPTSARAWGDLGAACDAHHLYEDAALCYRQARQLAPREFRWLYHLAVVLDFQGAPPEEVDALFEAALRLEPDYPPGHLRHGDALVRQGRAEEARAAFERALQLDPDFAMAHRNLGQVLLTLGEDAAALEHLQEAVRLEPEDGVTLASLAQALWRTGDPAEAERVNALAERHTEVLGVPDPIRYEVDRQSTTPFNCELRVRRALAQGHWSEAIPDLELLVEMAPDAARHHVDLGRCLARTGRAAEAREHLERALALEPGNLGALAERALLDLAAGDLEDAERVLVQLSERAPDDGEVWKRLGNARGQRGDLAGAAAAFAKAGALLPADAELEHNWGTTLSRLGDQAGACEHFEAALALRPDSAGTHFNLANSLELLGRKDQAAIHYRRAGELDARLPTAERLGALGR
jgi:protein O-GlcNAc transferase